MNEILFSLVLDTETMISIEISLLTMWIECYDELSNPVQLRANLTYWRRLKIKPPFEWPCTSNELLGTTIPK